MFFINEFVRFEVLVGFDEVVSVVFGLWATTYFVLKEKMLEKLRIE